MAAPFSQETVFSCKDEATAATRGAGEDFDSLQWAKLNTIEEKDLPPLVPDSDSLLFLYLVGFL